MYYTRENHKRFLDKELTAISESYLKLLNTKAISLLASNDVYVTQYVKLDLKKKRYRSRQKCFGLWPINASLQKRQRNSSKE